MRSALAVLAVVAISAEGARGEPPLAPEDFAFGRAIELEAEGPLQTVLLDASVYRGSVEPRLADLRVMNAAGEPVPHAVRQLRGPTRRESDVVPLPFFELDAPAAPDPAAGGASSFRLRAEVSESGALVEIDSRPPASATPSPATPPPRAYLIDASQVDAAIERLELELGDGADGFVVPVRVEASDDLVRFTSIGEGVLARLEQGGHRIEKRDLDLAGSRHRYLRIRWPAARLPVRVTGVRAHRRPAVEPPPRARTRVAGEPIPGEPGAFRFDLGGAIPTDGAQVFLPEANTLLQARIHSSPTRDGPWQLRHDGLLYRFEYGETLRNPEIAWPVSRDRYVKLETTPEPDPGSAAPELEVRWYPEQLLFIARGASPYQLVYGRHGAAPTPFEASEILQARPASAEPLPRATARLGPQGPRGDASLLEPAPPPRPYRTYALWAVLLLAVAVVLALSISLLRQMRKDADG